MRNDLAIAFFKLAIYSALLLPPFIQIWRRAGYSRAWAVLCCVPFVNFVAIAYLGPEILREAGYNPWWTLILFVPLFGLVALWVFAFSAWPADLVRRKKENEWSAADNELFKRLLEKQRS